MTYSIRQISLLAIITLSLLTVNNHQVFAGDKAPHKSDIAKGWSKTSVNATVFRKNSVVTFNNHQYVAFYDSLSHVILAKRERNTDTWELSNTGFKGHVKDAHNIISIMVDGDGYIHMSWDHHGNKLHYAKSLKPESLVMGKESPMVGKDEKNVTYPEFYKFDNGDLLFAYRDGASGRGNLVLNKYSVTHQKWSRIHSNLIDGENKRNAYWQMHMDASGVIHISWVWRETWKVETNHDMCYARSKDSGLTWENSQAQPYQLPINAANAEYVCRISQNSNLINQTSMTADEDGLVYIATYYKGAKDACTQFHVIYQDKTGWQVTTATQRTMDFSLSGGGSRSIPISRPQIMVKGKGQRKQITVIYRDEEHQNRACASSVKIKDIPNWETKEITNFSLGRWEPSYDTELWKIDQKLHLFIQNVGQGQGETSVEMPAQMVSILQVKL